MTQEQSPAPAIITVGDSYTFRLMFNETPIVIQAPGIEELSITSSLHEYLPRLKMKLRSGDGTLAHFIPFDDASTVQFSFAPGSGMTGEWKNYVFDIYRRLPQGDNMYEVEGLLQVPNLFGPNKCRGTVMGPKVLLDTIAQELDCTETDISLCLDYKKNLVQPYVPNAIFLRHLRQSIQGEAGEAYFYCFIDTVLDKKKFYFKTVLDFLRNDVKYKFLLGQSQTIPIGKGEVLTDYFFPGWSYYIDESYKLLGLSGALEKQYLYFNQALGTFVSNTVDLSNYVSLTPAYFYKPGDQQRTYNTLIPGRSNDYSGDFAGDALSLLYENMTNQSKISFLTIGLKDIVPGDLIEIQFAPQELYKTIDPDVSSQYAGTWMVETIVHGFGDMYYNKITATRSGVDAYQTSLAVPEVRKR